MDVKAIVFEFKIRYILIALCTEIFDISKTIALAVLTGIAFIVSSTVDNLFLYIKHNK